MRFILLCAFMAGGFAAVLMPAIASEPAPSGLNWRGLEIRPELTLGGRYDSNIFAADQDEESDFVYVVRPSLRVERSSGNLDINLLGEAEVREYQDNSSENALDIRLKLDGVYKPNASWQVPFGLRLSREARERGTPQLEDLTEDITDEDEIYAYLGLTHQMNRLSIGVRGWAAHLSFEDGVSRATTAQPVIFSDQDRDLYGGAVRLSYDISRDRDGRPALEVFTSLSAEQQNFDRRSWEGSGFTGRIQDRQEYGALVGLGGHYKGLLSGRVAAGALRQEFDESGRDSINTYDLEADIKYQLRRNAALFFEAGRSVNPEDIIESNYALGLAYSPRRNLRLDGRLSLDEFDFRETSQDGREDTDYGGSMTLTYDLNRNLSAEAMIGYNWRESNRIASEFDRTVIGLFLIGKL